MEGRSWARQKHTWHSLYFQTQVKVEGWLDRVWVWAYKNTSPLGGWTHAECTVPEDSFCTETAATEGSEGGWRFTALRFLSSLVLFLRVECKDHTYQWIFKTMRKLLPLSTFTNRRQLVWLLTSNFLCYWSFLNKLWSCVLTRVTTVATTHLRKGQTTTGREKNTSESAP